MKKVQPIDVANFFLSAIDEDAGDLISNLKMQKLVYYAQGIHLAMFDEELFSEEIRAWEHGPVVPELYHKFKSFGRGAIEPNFESFDIDIFTQKQKEMLKEVYNTFGQFSAWMLRNMTHEERPWVETTKNGTIIGSVINKKLLTEYFKTQIED
ncbi:MAG TPA: DUF4065 domain-containing protein [Lutibacter sp.]|nr:DUF4065 domain-containing protein [Lutibacter sp.]